MKSNRTPQHPIRYHSAYSILDCDEVANDTLQLVGNTPLLRLNNLEPRPGIQLYAKLESQNPSGSVKDRIVTAMVEDAERRGLISPGNTIVEAGTGNPAV